ncbi:MAG: hemolysin family protein [Alphaproteobacteria bacterium]
MNYQASPQGSSPVKQQAETSASGSEQSGEPLSSEPLESPLITTVTPTPPIAEPYAYAPAQPVKSSSESFFGRIVSVFRLLNNPKLLDRLQEFSDEEKKSEHWHPQANDVLSGVISSQKLTVSDVMTPRADIKAIPADTSLEGMLEIMADAPHSRYPIYQDYEDDVIGIVYVKDIYKILAGKEKFDLKTYTRHVAVVAPSLPLMDLLSEFRQFGTQIALVVDEYGGIDGLVTLEDLLEGMIGDIGDETPIDHVAWHERADGTILVDGRLDIEEFEQKMGTVFSEDEKEDCETLGGMVASLAGRVPLSGESVQHPRHGFTFDILEADTRRIKKLCVRKNAMQHNRIAHKVVSA